MLNLAGFLLLVVGAIAQPAGANDPAEKPLVNSSAPNAAAAPLTAFAALGSSFAQSNHLAELGWSETQISAFLDGVRATFQNKGYPFDEAARRVSEDMAHKIK